MTGTTGDPAVNFDAKEFAGAQQNGAYKFTLKSGSVSKEASLQVNVSNKVGSVIVLKNNEFDSLANTFNYANDRVLFIRNGYYKTPTISTIDTNTASSNGTVYVKAAISDDGVKYVVNQTFVNVR